MRQLLIALLLSTLPLTTSADDLIAHPIVELQTTEGKIVLELDTKRAPLTVRNFVKLVRSGYYNGTIFHRIARGFVVQGGGYNTKYESKESEQELPNESGNGLRNERGTVAMARLEYPHSANAQFFINIKDNPHLDPNPDQWGYTVFGEVIEGMDIIDLISNFPTGPGGHLSSEVPLLPIVINKALVTSD
ncbi:MAG: peptidylprolyl isomerase [Pseudomonadota bacterium]